MKWVFSRYEDSKDPGQRVKACSLKKQILYAFIFYSIQ